MHDKVLEVNLSINFQLVLEILRQITIKIINSTN